MAVGARDYIDQLLVKKYAQEKVDGSQLTSMINPDKMMEAMNDYSNMHKNMFTLSQKLSTACYAIKARNAQYKQAAVLDNEGYYQENNEECPAT